jgi:LacI family transcriptional regulator
MTEAESDKGRVTIIEIAKAAGVSKSTVSLVLTGRGSVKRETAERIQRAMDQLGYVYNRGAAGLRNAGSNIVGIVINDLSNPFFAELSIGIQNVLQMSGYVAFLAHTGESVSQQSQVIRMMRENGARGIILCPALDTRPEDVEGLASGDASLVLSIRRIAGSQASLVVPDNRAGAARITRHLLNLGHRRIAYVGGMGSMVVRQDRFLGFADAMADAKCAIDPGLNIESLPTKDGGVRAMGAVLALADRPTAVVCYNDVVAIGAMLAAARRGLSVGTDIAVVGFDDTEEARHVVPALTTVSVDAVGLGERSARMLLDQIADRNAAGATYVGEAKLIIRESCGIHHRALAAAG